ncbi:MAG: extracellular solute-binding protein [Candidatus Acidiferrales bacterium]
MTAGSFTSRRASTIATALLSASLFLSLCPSNFAQASPPWGKGRNNPAEDKGFVFEVPDIDNVPNLHGNPEDAKLVLFVGGNQFFVLPELIAAFESHHPELRGHIFYETLPPGVLREQMAHGGRLTLGNFTIHVEPDVYAAGAATLANMEKQHQVEKAVSYVTNDLGIMVSKSNPKRIESLRDLAKPDIRLSMPNQEFEGVARQIAASLRKAGGDDLFRAVYQEKAKNGSTYLTEIHHRQTPMRIMKGESDAGVTWSSEIRFQEKIGNPIEGVSIPKSENTTATYAAGVVTNAPHTGAARAWVTFLTSPEAQHIYAEYGFGSVN